MQITIADGCIACGVCESICPNVFKVHENCEADNGHVAGHEIECRDAAEACPVSVIVIQE